MDEVNNSKLEQLFVSQRKDFEKTLKTKDTKIKSLEEENNFLSIKNLENIKIKERLVIENIKLKVLIQKLNEKLEFKVKADNEVDGNDGDGKVSNVKELKVENENLLKENARILLEKHKKVKKIDNLLKDKTDLNNKLVKMRVELNLQRRQSIQLERKFKNNNVNNNNRVLGTNEVRLEKRIRDLTLQKRKMRDMCKTLIDLLCKVYDID